MKFLLLSLLLLPVVGLAQTPADYDKAFRRFMTFYNKGQADSICAMFYRTAESDEECFWKLANSESTTLDEYGSILAYRYLGIDATDPEKVRVFKVRYSKAGTKAMSFTLVKAKPTGSQPAYAFGTFRLITSSEQIAGMLRKAP